MEFSNTPFKEILEVSARQAKAFALAKFAYLKAKFEYEHAESILISATPGKSQAEKTNNAKASKEWLLINMELAKAEARFELERLNYGLCEKEYQAQYLEHKIDHDTIKRG